MKMFLLKLWLTFLVGVLIYVVCAAVAHVVVAAIHGDAFARFLGFFFAAVALVSFTGYAVEQVVKG